MLSIFNLENYKEYLINYYVYNCDGTEENRLKRKELLERRYSDSYLQNIINDTEEFALSLLDSCNNYVSFDIEQREEYVLTNCAGGYSPDVLIPIEEIGKSIKISKYLLECFLGDSFKVYLDEHEEEYYDDEEDYVIGCTYYYPKLTISGDFSKKKQEFKQKKQTELVRVLKRIS